MFIPTSVESLLDVLQRNLARARRDNDLIYHKDIPPSSAIAPIQDVIMVQSNLLSGLLDPKGLVGGGRVLFGELLGWGAREAVSTSILAVFESQYPIWSSDIYNDNKQSLIKERITDFAQELDNEVDQFVLASSSVSLRSPSIQNFTLSQPPFFTRSAGTTYWTASELSEESRRS